MEGMLSTIEIRGAKRSIAQKCKTNGRGGGEGVCVAQGLCSNQSCRVP